MKTPDEIKKELIAGGSTTHILTGMPQAVVTTEITPETAFGAVVYIHQLESRLAQAERERDAAVADLCEEAGCGICKHYPEKMTARSACFNCDMKNHSNFEWRGVCAENTKEE